MTLRLELHTQPPAPVSVDGLSPAPLAGHSAAEIAALALRCGRRQLRVGDLFDVAGSGADELRFSGDLRRIDGIGAGMSSGRVLVDGLCGDHLGARMRGGELDVNGDVGDWAGAEMAGGLLRISGHAGARLGGAYPGMREGMRGGEIVITGDAGEETGAGMRRGLIGIGGHTGAGAGLAMLAGTVIALGGIGPEPGQGNRRGSLVSAWPVELPAGYALATVYRPPALALQLRRIRALGLSRAELLVPARWERWSGDRTELGKGEILITIEEDR